MKFYQQAEHFTQFFNTLNHKGITDYSYFVNWAKVLANITPIERELNLLNTVVGKADIPSELFSIFKEYPKTIKTIPTLLAIRHNSIEVLIDTTEFIYKTFDFSIKNIDDQKIHALIELLIQSGFIQLLATRQIKSIPDYCIGVEVGLDSNGRKNRGGTSMEGIIESFVAILCHEQGLDYLAQADAAKIKAKWGIDIQVDKSSRRIDFVIKKAQTLYFIECNFYGGGGSKLKSTATEYKNMSEYWQKQNINFIWITDGAGWQTAKRPLEEYFDTGSILLNIDMVRSGGLERLINAEDEG